MKRKAPSQESTDQSDDIYLLKNFQDQLLNNIVLRGVSSIKNCLVRKLQNNLVKEDGKFVTDTSVSNFVNEATFKDVFKEVVNNEFPDKKGFYKKLV